MLARTRGGREKKKKGKVFLGSRKKCYVQTLKRVPKTPQKTPPKNSKKQNKNLHHNTHSI